MERLRARTPAEGDDNATPYEELLQHSDRVSEEPPEPEPPEPLLEPEHDDSTFTVTPEEAEQIERERLERQEPLALELPKCVAVVGCGGVGSWAALFLAMAGVEQLYLFDFDEVSGTNLNRLPVPVKAAFERMGKTEALRWSINFLRPSCRILAMAGFSAELADNLDLGEEVQWLVCTTDTLASRQMVYQWCRRNGVNYVEAAAEGDVGSCTGAPAEWATPEEQAPGYAHVPVWVGPCVAAAQMAVAHIVHNTYPGDNSYRLGWSESGVTAQLHNAEEEL